MHRIYFVKADQILDEEKEIENIARRR